MTADFLGAAADYCARLAAVEHAHILGDSEEVDHLLSNVDPIDVRHVANVLRSLEQEIRGGTSDAEMADTPVSPPLNRGTRAAHLHDAAGHLHSVRVPCS